jgi:hypothetical protein
MQWHSIPVGIECDYVNIIRIGIKIEFNREESQTTTFLNTNYNILQISENRILLALRMLSKSFLGIKISIIFFIQ